jgi:hypothetical protein
MPNYRVDNMTWQQYKDLIGTKHGPWVPNGTVEIINSGGYRYVARTNAAEWWAGFIIDYQNAITGKTIGKFRFTQ